MGLADSACHSKHDYPMLVFFLVIPWGMTVGIYKRMGAEGHMCSREIEPLTSDFKPES